MLKQHRLPMTLLPALAIILLSSSCANNGKSPSDSYCVVAKPIYISSKDILTPITERQILENNINWKKLCNS